MTFTQKDLDILEAIYCHRCLSSDQLFRKLYNATPSSASSYFREKLSVLLKEKLVEKVKPSSSQSIPAVYFLTARGINVIRGRLYYPTGGIDTFDMPAYKLKVNESFIPHQHYLNSFAINALQLLETIDGVSYVDERHMKISEFVRPDGMIVIPQKEIHCNGVATTIPKTILYLECDMGTEARHTIREKFLRYRAHLESSASEYDSRHIILFFCKDERLSPKEITYGITPGDYEESKQMKDRLVTLKKEIMTAVGDKLGEKFEIIIGTQPRVLANLKLKYISEYFGINPASLLYKVDKVITQFQKDLELKDVTRLAKFTNGISYDAYAKSDRYQKSFIFLDYYDSNLSVLSKIVMHRANSKVFRDTMHRDLTLVVLLHRTDVVRAIRKLCDLKHYEYDDVWFAYVDDLKTRPMHEAIFKIASYGIGRYNDTMTTVIPTAEYF